MLGIIRPPTQFRKNNTMHYFIFKFQNQEIIYSLFWKAMMMQELAKAAIVTMMTMCRFLLWIGSEQGNRSYEIEVFSTCPKPPMENKACTLARFYPSGGRERMRRKNRIALSQNGAGMHLIQFLTCRTTDPRRVKAIPNPSALALCPRL